MTELPIIVSNSWWVRERGANDDQRNKSTLDTEAIAAGHLPPHSPIILEIGVIHGYWKRLQRACNPRLTAPLSFPPLVTAVSLKISSIAASISFSEIAHDN